MSSQLNPRRVANLPPSVHEIAALLESQGFAVWITGESWLQLLLGQTPPALELTTTAPSTVCLDRFDHAVPTHPQRGVVTLPTSDGPLDLRSLRPGEDVTDDLARRDFTVLAIAYRLTEEKWVDPSGGLADLEAERLGWVGGPDAADSKIAADPPRMLRAARLVSEYGFTGDDVEEAITRNAPLVRNSDATRARGELVRMLLSDRPDAGLGLLKRTGLESVLVPSVRPDAAALVASLPRALPLRMAAWLRGTRPRDLLRRMRFGLARSRHVERLLEHHPLDARVNPKRDRAISRLLRLLTDADIAGLLQMREWELRSAENSEDEADVQKKLAAITQGIERIRDNQARSHLRTELALSGRSVMELLGYGPGRRVGAALRFASELVARDPSQNEEARLREALLEWDRQNPSKKKG